MSARSSWLRLAPLATVPAASIGSAATLDAALEASASGFASCIGPYVACLQACPPA